MPGARSKQTCVFCFIVKSLKRNTPKTERDPIVANELGGYWIVTSIAIGALLCVIGWAINGSILGILIDHRNKISLSRFQVAIWTWIFASSILAVALKYQTTEITLGTELLALMGISLGSSAGAIIVKGTKESVEPAPEKLARLPKFNRKDGQALKRAGVLQQNNEPRSARIIDMFKGEEITDFEYADISKIQMFFFSIVVWLGYISQLWNWEITAGEPITFPLLTSSSLLTLLGVSHAGYLTTKAAPKVGAG